MLAVDKLTDSDPPSSFVYYERGPAQMTTPNMVFVQLGND